MTGEEIGIVVTICAACLGGLYALESKRPRIYAQVAPQIGAALWIALSVCIGGATAFNFGASQQYFADSAVANGITRIEGPIPTAVYIVLVVLLVGHGAIAWLSVLGNEEPEAEPNHERGASKDESP